MGKTVFRRIFSPEEKERGGSYALIERSPQAESELQPQLGKAEKKAGFRLWMRFDAGGNSEVVECDKHMIM
ncbi:hypothetical protein KI387_017567, partial [Taxus chinensis]